MRPFGPRSLHRRFYGLLKKINQHFIMKKGAQLGAFLMSLFIYGKIPLCLYAISILVSATM